jgi:hypothetical protein
MKWLLALKPQADRDITNHFEYLAKATVTVAVRFFLMA